MLVAIEILSFFIAALGTYKNIKNRNLILFIWVIVLYYSITLMFAMSSDVNSLVPYNLKITFAGNFLLGVFAFFLSDKIFNKNAIDGVSFTFLNNEKNIRVMEVVFWISYTLTFLELRLLDYETYTNYGGAGWAQVFFMLTSGVIFYYSYRRKWLHLVAVFLMMGVIIAATGVRSLMFYVIIPIIFYYIYITIHTIQNIGEFVWKVLPLLLLIIGSVFLVDTLRFGEVDLPETELTNIALHCMENWDFGLQYMNSIWHYALGLLTPVNNLLEKFGVYWLDLLQSLFPSIPKLNALIYSGMVDVSLIGAYHMPATIFYNFYMSWGNFACIAAFFTYWAILKIFNAFQKNIFRIMLFSPILGWHFYMVMRGASDTAARGIAYPLLIGLILCISVERKNYRTNEKNFINHTSISRNYPQGSI